MYYLFFQSITYDMYLSYFSDYSTKTKTISHLWEIILPFPFLDALFVTSVINLWMRSSRETAQCPCQSCNRPSRVRSQHPLWNTWGAAVLNKALEKFKHYPLFLDVTGRIICSFWIMWQKFLPSWQRCPPPPRKWLHDSSLLIIV